MGKISAFNITGVLATLLAAQGALAADLMLDSAPLADQKFDLTLPAVSGPNGKWELYGGPANPGSAAFRAAASYSLPVGHSYGVQFDVGLQGSGAGFLAGGAVHAFTRDPDNYLFGVAGGVVRGPTGTLGVLGLEGELYLDRFSFEVWTGVAGINYDVLPDVTGAFILADAAYYFTDDFRGSLGVSHLLGVSGLHIGAEYQLRDYDLPISLAADARFNSDGSYSVMGGIKGYFGAPGKSLIDRHRQDDPPNRALSLFAVSSTMLNKVLTCTAGQEAGSGTYSGQCVPSDPEEFCSFSEGSWDWNGEAYYCNYGSST